MGHEANLPECATRFYDLGKDDPVTCIECGTTWAPEPILKSKQPLPFEQATPESAKKKDQALAGGSDDDHDDDDDLDIDEDAEASPDDEVDLGDDESDIGGVKHRDEDEEN